MLFNDETEIVNTARKPFRVAKLDKFIASRNECPFLTEKEDCRLAQPIEGLLRSKPTP
jgi:hypothetical protein